MTSQINPCGLLITEPDGRGHRCRENMSHIGAHECACSHRWERCASAGTSSFWCAVHESRWSGGPERRACDHMSGGAA